MEILYPTNLKTIQTWGVQRRLTGLRVCHMRPRRSSLGSNPAWASCPPLMSFCVVTIKITKAKMPLSSHLKVFKSFTNLRPPNNYENECIPTESKSIHQHLPISVSCLLQMRWSFEGTRKQHSLLCLLPLSVFCLIDHRLPSIC